MIRLSLPMIFLFIVIPQGAASAQSAEAVKPVDFAREILPILSNKCFVCHGPDAHDKDLVRLDLDDDATRDRDGYRVIDRENPAASHLLTRITSDEDPMPPENAEKQLTETERSRIREWILQGGSYARHWAFVPPTKRGDKSRIDQFILEPLEASVVQFAPEADKATLARRVALTLTGLPPEPDALSAFMKDSEAGAYERYVDRLMQSTRYGEHQARYWLDAVRYGDTHGLHLDNRRGIYPYRDWVVRALNQNLPLDQFITWQLAGDLLPEPTLDQLVATGFVRMNPSTSEGGAIPEEFQAKNNFDRTETLGTVLLGMTLTCARCHTHKYDPITQREYYELLAFFNSTAENALDGNKYDYGPTVKVPVDQADWRVWDELQQRRTDVLAESDREFREFQQSWIQTPADQRFALLSKVPFEVFPSTQLQEKAAQVAERLAELESRFTTTLVAEDLDEPRETRLLERGEYDRPLGEPLTPGVPSVMGPWPDNAPVNRLGLAEWLTSAKHPLTTRVLVNRIWQQVYGYGLVRTPEDFGLQGQQPTHPELLDWLAVELRESGWDLKHMLKLMVTSQTFRQSSAFRSDVQDPENRSFARGPSFRLDAEVIRDTALWASGLLNRQMGGEGIKPYQPEGMWEALAHPASNTKQYERDKNDLLYRRSLYVYWKRTSPHPMMTLFDAPDRESSCVRRSRTNTSLQSLGLLNETQRIEMSRKFAERLLLERRSDRARITWMFKLLACRAPTERERDACSNLVKAMRARYEAEPEAASLLLSQGDATVNPDLDPRELAAWTQVAITVLASDIALLLF